MASSKIFKIPELLEMVLVHLPALDLLMCQRINSTWRDIIKESNPLQEKLFYKCDLVNMDVDDLPWLKKNTSRGINTLSVDNFPGFDFNPFIQLLHRRRNLARRNNQADANGLGNLDYPEASWKKMYLSRPAVCKIDIYKKVPNSSTSDLLTQITQHDTIKMNHSRESCSKRREFLRLSQSNGIRMHHLQEMDLSTFGILVSNRTKYQVFLSVGRGSGGVTIMRLL